MARIQVLDAALADQIAAGEVVERPASVVKELLENALDAQATAITVSFEEGGIKQLRVVDNGHGMSREEAPLALKRHATSKIQRLEDLIRIATLGFRGEALPSIASVSRFTMRTRTAEELAATKISIVGGKDLTVTDAAGPVGTEMVMEDLFFNIPARRKFLKKQQTEASHIQEAVHRLALAHPGVAFRLVRDGRTVTDVPRHDSLADRARALFGEALAGRLQPVSADGPFQLSGLVGPPDEARSTARHYYLFINGRFVRDRVMMSAVQAAYRDVVRGARHPFVILSLTVPPEAVDVNVHPAKTEVRFVDSGPIHRVISRAIRAVIEVDPWSAPEPEAPQKAGRQYTLSGGPNLFEPRPATASPTAEAPSPTSGGPTSPNPMPSSPVPSSPVPSSPSAPAGAPASGVDAHRQRVFDVMARLSARRAEMRGSPAPAEAMPLEEGMFPPPGVPLPVERAPRPAIPPRDLGQTPAGPGPGVPSVAEPATTPPSEMPAAEMPAAEMPAAEVPAAEAPSIGKAPAIAELLGASGKSTRDLPPTPPDRAWPEVGRGEGAVPFGALRFAGLIGERFALAEAGDALLLVDVDAASERVIWLRLREGAGGGGVPLPMPSVLHLNPSRQQRFTELRAPLSRLGFALEPFGGDAVALSRVPMPAAGLDPVALLEILLDEAPDEAGLYATLAAKVAEARPLRSLTEIAALLQALHHAEAKLGQPGQRGPWTVLPFIDLQRRPFPGGRPSVFEDGEESS